MMSAASDAWSQGASASQRACDPPLACAPLAVQILEQRRGVTIRARRADEDAVDRRGPRIHVGGDRNEPRQLIFRVAIGEVRSNLRSIGQRHRLVVTGDRHVEKCLEDPALGGEQPVHGGWRHARVGADGLDRRSPVAAFNEQGSGGVDDSGARQAGPGLAAFTRGSLFRGRHVLRLLLSI
jgi:hypothetical protein